MYGLEINNQEQPAPTPRLIQLSGINSGATFLIRSFRTTLGRSESNHIVIQDESVSRVHAIIEKNEDGTLIISDNQSRNGIAINGVKKEMSLIQSGDQISLGSIILKLELPRGRPLLVNSENLEGDTPAPQNRLVQKLNKRVLLYGGLGLVLIFVLMTNSESDSKSNSTSSQDSSVSSQTGIKLNVSDPPKPMSSANTNQANQIVDLTKGELEQDLERLSFLDGSVEDSEVHFRRGQREFFNKNYHRAINSLELAVSLNKGHPSASYYLQSAIHEAEKEASKNLEVGIKYFSSLQYKRAIYHFKQVQSLLSHKKDDPILKKCSEYIQIAEERLKAAELYP